MVSLATECLARSDFILCSSLWLSISLARYRHQPLWSSVPLWGGVGRAKAAASACGSEGGGREPSVESRKEKESEEGHKDMWWDPSESPVISNDSKTGLSVVCDQYIFQVSTLFHKFLFAKYVFGLLFISSLFPFSRLLFRLCLNISQFTIAFFNLTFLQRS